jgi:hypothetical protein
MLDPPKFSSAKKNVTKQQQARAAAFSPARRRSETDRSTTGATMGGTKKIEDSADHRRPAGCSGSISVSVFGRFLGLAMSLISFSFFASLFLFPCAAVRESCAFVHIHVW